MISTSEFAGFIVTVVQSMPSKKLKEVDFDTLLSRFKDPNFATRYNRSKIKLCEDVGFNLNYFFKLTLATLKQISDHLNL